MPLPAELSRDFDHFLIWISWLFYIDIFKEQSDLHLKDYDSEIFDDDDFYHQVFNIQYSFIYIAHVSRKRVAWIFQMNAGHLGTRESRHQPTRHQAKSPRLMD